MRPPPRAWIVRFTRAARTCNTSRDERLSEDVIPIDHIMMGVADFEGSAARWESQHQLRTVRGIAFDDAPAFANWAVPLGETWIELVGVAEGADSDSDPRARMFSEVVSSGDRVLGWALVPDDFEGVARRLGLPISHQHGTHSVTGERFTWRQVGFDETRLHYYLPFFLSWDHDAHGDAARATDEIENAHAHAADVTLELTGDPARLEDWLGDIEAPVTIRDGPPSITAHIPTDRGTLTIS